MALDAAGLGTGEVVPPARKAGGAERWALGAFVVYLITAGWVLVALVGPNRWFVHDDWAFLIARDGGSLHDLLDDHGGHLTLLPVVAYRLLFNLFGLHYTPYLVLVVALHLTVVVLLRVIMRRAGVGPWIATAAASALVLFGPGRQNFQSAFQITFMGAMVLGLSQLILADHDGPLRRRDWVGVVAGIGAVLCSGIGPIMVTIVALSTLLRRGWRMALFHGLPPALLYLTWYIVTDPSTTPRTTDMGVMVDWTRVGQTTTFVSLGHWSLVGAALAVMLVTGLLLWCFDRPPGLLRRRAAPVALLVGVPLFFVVTAQTRWFFGPTFIEASRYIYVAAALTLPALALAAEAIATRWRNLTPILVVLLLAGVPGNIGELDGEHFFVPEQANRARQTVLGLAYADGIDAAPGWVVPYWQRLAEAQITVEWLREARAAGRVPHPESIDPDIDGQFPLRLGLVHAPRPAELADCQVDQEAVDLELRRDDELRFLTSVRVRRLDADGSASPPVRFDPQDGSGTLVVVAPSIRVRLSPAKGASSFEWCR